MERFPIDFVSWLEHTLFGTVSIHGKFKYDFWLREAFLLDNFISAQFLLKLLLPTQNYITMDNEQGPLSLVITIKELLERRSSCSGLENREYGRRDPSRWSRGTLYPQKLTLTLPTSGDRSVCIVRSRTEATEFFWGGQQNMLLAENHSK
jgi:hypothetical protein